MVKPTVVGARAEPSSPEPKLKPTLIKPTVKQASPLPPSPVKPSSLASLPSKPPAKAISPSALPGSHRAPINVSVEELRKLFPTVEPDIIDTVRAQLLGINLESLDSVAVLTLGSVSQERYGKLVDAWVELTKRSVATAALRHISRLKDILQELLESFGESGWRDLKQLFKRESFKSRFSQVAPEIVQLKGVLHAAESDLVQEVKALKALREATQAALREAKALTVACEYLADRARSDVRELIVERGIAAGKVVALCVAQALKLEEAEKLTITLVSNIQEVVRLEVSALFTLVTSAEDNDTQRFIIKDKVMSIIQKL